MIRKSTLSACTSPARTGSSSALAIDLMSTNGMLELVGHHSSTNRIQASTPESGNIPLDQHSPAAKKNSRGVGSHMLGAHRGRNETRISRLLFARVTAPVRRGCMFPTQSLPPRYCKGRAQYHGTIQDCVSRDVWRMRG